MVDSIDEAYLKKAVIDPPPPMWYGSDGHKHDWKTNRETYERYCAVSECGAIFKDMDTYLCQVCKDMPIKTVIDVGCGLKGVVGDHFWRRKMKITKGWACDIWKIKRIPFWKPIKDDALKLDQYFKPNSIDVVQAFGFLEHLEKEDGYKWFEIAERIAKRVVIVSAATELHGRTKDYKLMKDQNPYHYYRSIWHWKEYEAMGYTSNIEDAKKRLTFQTEAFGWKVLK